MSWNDELVRWLGPFLDRLGHKKRRQMCPLYVAGLIGPGERKSMEPIAVRLAPDHYDRLHHFISAGVWDAAPVEEELAIHANRMVGGSDSVLVIDDTALARKGRHSVGVAPQYASALGKRANCQTLVSLTLARDDVPVMVGLRLFLPKGWTGNAERMERAGVPEPRRTPRTKPEIALDEIDRLMAAGVRFGTVLADAGYGLVELLVKRPPGEVRFLQLPRFCKILDVAVDETGQILSAASLRSNRGRLLGRDIKFEGEKGHIPKIDSHIRLADRQGISLCR